MWPILITVGLSARTWGQAEKPPDLRQTLAQAIRSKHGYDNSIAVSVAATRRPAVPGFLEADVVSARGNEKSTDTASISDDGHFYTEGVLVPISSPGTLQIETGLKSALGPNAAEIAITQPSKWTHPGFLHGYAYFTSSGHPSRQDYYVSQDGKSMVVGELYYLYSPGEIRTLSMGKNRVLLGSPNAESSLVIFSDFQCPECAQLEKTIDFSELLRTRPGLSIIFRNYPLNYHSWSREAALASNCVFRLRPAEYVRFRQLVFSAQNAITPENAATQLGEIALRVNVNGDAFKGCLSDSAAAQELQDDLDAGDQLQLYGTPSSFVNGIPLPMLWSMADLDAALGAKHDHPARAGAPVSTPCGDCRVRRKP